MAGCYTESWTMKDLTDSLRNMNKDNKHIVVPMFQRGKRWKVDQELRFIESLKQGFPVGTMLFYKRVENNKEVYTLVDGLQRGNTIKKYMLSPTKYFLEESIPSTLIDDIHNLLGLTGSSSQIKSKITEIIKNSIYEFEGVDQIETYHVAKKIQNEFPMETEKFDSLMNLLIPFIKGYKELNDEISKSTIPVIVYTGDEDNLPVIFDRINSQGTPLTQYEVYAASWPIDKKFYVKNSNIIDKVIKKYDSLADDEYAIHGYDRDSLRKTKQLNAFEYLFGLGKVLNDLDFLHFEKNEAADEINTMAFELVNACLNNGRDGIKTLYNEILNIDVNQFEERLFEAVEFVRKIISQVTLFKGNTRNSNQILYSKFQILSMIACTFKEKYDLNNISIARRTWNQNRSILEKNMLYHFIYDIITDEWSNGGTTKIYSVSKPNKYMVSIPKTTWESALNNYFEQLNTRNEKAKVSNPKNADIIILNCIYLSTFTALNQLSIEKFDIEHIAPKEQMKDLITACKGEGLPISSIANLCYLPEYINRSKKKKNFYQDKGYTSKVNLSEVEEKYSFTCKEDLEWMDMPFQDGDYEQLKEYYLDFLTKRYNILKEKFYISMKI